MPTPTPHIPGIRNGRKVCADCDGTGTVLTTTWDSPWREKEIECPECEGSGEPDQEEE